MPSLTVDNFKIGIDRRKGANVSDANRLRVCTNAFITNGNAVQKRPGLKHQFDLSTDHADTIGLFSAQGSLNVFKVGVTAGAFPTDSRFFLRSIDPETNGGAGYAGNISMGTLQAVWFATVIANAIFVIVEGATTTRGFWLDATYEALTAPSGGTSWGTVTNKTNGANMIVSSDFRMNEANPPASPSAIKLASRIFHINDELVDFCSLDYPPDWTTAGSAGEGAGFLAVGRQALGSDEVLALGQYQGDLIPLFEDAAQSWNVDADSDFNSFQQSIDGVGSRYPRTVKNLAGDTFFLSANGFRSISLLSLTNNLADVDVGTAIEDLVRAKLAAFSGEPVAEYNAGGGQYICAFEDEAYVYSFSRTAKVSAWSKYEWTIDVTDMTSHNGVLWLRAGEDTYTLDDNTYQDETAGGGGTAEDFEVVIELAYLDFKEPGKLKYITDFDVVCVGTCEVSFKYEYYPDEWCAGATAALNDYVRPTAPNGRRFICTTAGTTGTTEPTWNTTIGGTTNDGTAVWTTQEDGPVEAETAAQTVYGNTRPGELFPVELTVTQVAPVIRAEHDEFFRLDAITLHYEKMGALS